METHVIKRKRKLHKESKTEPNNNKTRSKHHRNSSPTRHRPTTPNLHIYAETPLPQEKHVLPVLPPRDQLAGAGTNTITWTPLEARQKPLKGFHRRKGTDLDLSLPKPAVSTVGKTGGTDGQANRRTTHQCNI
ncbi:hypothetical protein TSUD_364390 [Trifolium subterraneum]|uniref:Uncharacterized protein n=1 Tax=Trifolium subterraneum TaxID=3900 RepID=A0A2Z6MCI6_TRISU|nr:hypothetical protein TSUD_364390 [Trifolium subterraneum]